MQLRLATLEQHIALWKEALPAAAGCQSPPERRLRHADRRIFLGQFGSTQVKLRLEQPAEEMIGGQKRPPEAVAAFLRARCAA